MDKQEKTPRKEPVTIEEKLEDIRRRLGRIEMHLINMRGKKVEKQA